MRPVAERMGVPRALYTDFPLGRSLGKPSDQQFQFEVLRAAFALLKEPAGPVIGDFPVSVSLDDSQPLQCPLPPRFNAPLSVPTRYVVATCGADGRLCLWRSPHACEELVTADGAASPHPSAASTA